MRRTTTRWRGSSPAVTRAPFGTATDTNRLFAYQSGADGFAVRPIHGSELIDIVRGVLAREPDERVEYRRAQLMGGATTA